MRALRPACPICGHIHASNDARRVGRFTDGGQPRFAAATAPTPIRETRTEAEADECQWRIARKPLIVKPSAAPTESRPSAKDEQKPAETPEFPTAEMETAARAKAWHDFLSEALFSLQVWQLDEGLHANCEHVLTWLRRCRNELDGLVSQ